MRHFLIIGIFILSISISHAQVEKKYHSQSESLPQWAQMMYQEDADIGAVIEAYETYYKNHPFRKNGHTQYYKRWLRTIKRDINGFSSKTNDWRTAKELNEEYQQRISSRSPTSPWTCIGPFDFDKAAVDRSYAAGAAHIYTVEQAMSNTNILYAGTATAGLWKSTDKGLNWTPMTNDMLVNNVIAIEIDHTNPDIVYFEGAGILYKTTNGGTSWTAIGDATFQSSGHELTDIIMHPTNNQILFLCANDGLYRTDDAGLNFTRIKGGEFQELEFHPSNNNILYAVKEVDNRTEFYKSVDGGLTFNLTGSGWPGIASTTTANFPSIQMDANGEYLTANSNINPGNGSLVDFSIEMRIKAGNWSGDPAFFSNKNWNSGNNKGFVMACNSNGNTWKFNMSDGSNRIDVNGGSISDGEWHHIAVTYDADGDKHIYQNGELINTSTAVITDAVNTTLDLVLGQDGTTSYGNNFNGNIAEVRVWRSILSATEIQDYRCQTVTNTHPQWANLVHYWKMDEGTGTSMSDAIGGNTFTSSGSTSWSTSQNLTCVTTNLSSSDEQRRTEIATSPADPTKVYALCTGSANGGSGLYGIYVSSDEGVNWTRTCCGPQPAGVPSLTNQNLMAWSDQGTDDGGQYYYDLAFDVADNNADHLFVGGVNLWISTDGGNTFTCPSKWSHSYKSNYVHADIHDIRFFGNDLWIANDGGIFYSNDTGASFDRKMLGIAGTDFWGFDAGFWDGDVMVGGTYHNGTLLKDNNVYDNGWISTGGGDNTLGKVNYADERKVYYDYGERMLSGDRMTSNTSLPFNKDLWSRPFAFDPRSYNMIYVGIDAELWLTMDDGVNFELKHTFPANVDKIEVAWSNPDVIYVSTRGGWWDKKDVWKSIDGGTNWTNITPTLAEIGSRDWVRYDLTVDGTDENTVWLARKYPYSGNALDGFQVLKTTNGGSTWTTISTSALNGESATNIVHQRGTNGGVYIGTKRAVYYRNNNMADWALFNTDLPASTYSTDLIPFYKEGKIRNGTNRSVYEAEFYENSTPLAQISVDRFSSYCGKDTLYFSDHSSLNQNGATWAWSFPGGEPSTSTDRQPKVTYSDAGTYDVSLTVTDNFGSHSQTITSLITVENACSIDTIPQYAFQPNTSGHLNLGQPSDLDFSGTAPFSFSAWIKPNTNNMTGYILTKYDRFVVGQYQFGIENGKAYCSREVSPWSVTGSTDLLADQWYHIAATYDGTQLKIYVNGKLDGTTNMTGSISSINRDIIIGARYRSSNIDDHFDGLIDELCVWDKALDQGEIRDTRHLTKYEDEAGLVAYFQFNEDISESRVQDRIKANHGDMNGDAARVVSTAPVGGGKSSRLNVNSGGMFDFNEADVSIDFGGTHPNGEVVVTRINLNPDELPSAYPVSNCYWVINNYGSNPTFTELNGITFNKIGYVSNADVTTPNTFKLYKRNSNDDGTTWGSSMDDGDQTTAGLDGNVSFSTGNGITSFSQFIVSNEGTSLPVELLSFQARLNEQNQVRLTWETRSEINSDYFIIERSKNGTDFEEIGQIDAAGESNETLQYQSLDPSPYKGQSYYRLRMVDLDASFEYSSIRTIFINGKYNDIIVYPNPTEYWMNIETEWNESSSYVLFNANGKKVKSGTFEKSTSIDTSDLAKGSYMYRIIGNRRMFNGIIIIQ